jgi:electron transfer flavoprotein alpha subunit
MSKILIFCESTPHGQIKRSSLELLGAAKNSGQSICALAFGSSASKIAAEVGKYGATEVFVAKDGQLDKYNPELFAQGLFETIQKSGAKIILGSASSVGKDLFPRVAARLGAGVLSDCVSLKIEGDAVSAKKPVYSGKAFANYSFENSPYQMVLMRANQLPIPDAGSGSATVTELTVSKPDLKTIIKDVVKGATEKLDLTEANIIVSGGRGLKEASNFKLLQDLADVLGATVGASRAVVDAGWVSHNMQVGQTGKTVAPSLYIAVGISGAIQHLAGMSGSKVIVAINNDPNAPIFQKANYGIVGDLFEVIPKLTEEFKKVMH